MSIKKFNFLPDFKALSEWGHNKLPFFALVDFDGNVAGGPLKTGFLNKTGVSFSGQLDLAGGNVRFKFHVAPRNAGPVATAADFHSRGNRLIITKPPPKPEALAAIRILQQHLANGDAYLVNYCSQTEVVISDAVSSLYDQSAAPFTVWLEDEFLSFSPESFVTAMENQISTTPMKGTGFDAQTLLADLKEQAEHATVVDLLRNDLGQVAREISLGEYRYLTAIPQADGRTLYQTSTQINATLPPDWRSHIGDWLPKLLPAGSITGAPKKETVELIRRIETEPRGFFTGVAVLFDGDSLYSCVLIRFLDLAGKTPRFRSGAGITIYSDPEQEYAELLSKVYIPV